MALFGVGREQPEKHFKEHALQRTKRCFNAAWFHAVCKNACLYVYVCIYLYMHTRNCIYRNANVDCGCVEEVLQGVKEPHGYVSLCDVGTVCPNPKSFP